MNELSSEIHVLLTSTARNAVLTTDEYIDPTDGLIHCKSCGGQRQAVVPIPGSAECFTPRCLCPCQTLTEQHRRAAEEQRKRIERIWRSREQGLQGRHLCDYTFDNDNGHNPLLAPGDHDHILSGVFNQFLSANPRASRINKKSANNPALID